MDLTLANPNTPRLSTCWLTDRLTKWQVLQCKMGWVFWHTLGQETHHGLPVRDFTRYASIHCHKAWLCMSYVCLCVCVCIVDCWSILSPWMNTLSKSITSDTTRLDCLRSAQWNGSSMRPFAKQHRTSKPMQKLPFRHPYPLQLSDTTSLWNEMD